MRTKLFFLLATVLVSGCSKSFDGTEESSQTDEEITKVILTCEDFIKNEDNPTFSTKVTLNDQNHFIWVLGDTVGVYPAEGTQVYFAIDQGAGSETAVFDGGGWAVRSSRTYYSYYPFIGKMYLDRHRIPVSFTDQKQAGKNGRNHIGKCFAMYTNASSPSNGFLNFSYHNLCCIIRPKLTLPAGTYTKLAITAPTSVFAMKGHYDLQSESPSIVATETSNQLQIDLENVTLTSQSQFDVLLVSAPVDLKGVPITVSVLNDQKKEFQCSKTPSFVYGPNTLNNLTCDTWTEVPQNMGLIIDNWGDGGSIGGTAD